MFCDEKTGAYPYLSSRLKMVVCVIKLGRPICLDLVRNDYINYIDELKDLLYSYKLYKRLFYHKYDRIYYDDLAISVD